jgi:hypothetical protein
VSQPSGRNWRTNYWGVRPFKRHSLVLLVGGIAYVLVGLTYILAKPTPSRKLALVLALRWFPVEFWGGLFIFAGLLAILSARWPPVADTWGYTVLTALSAGWSATYAAGVIFEKSPTINLTAVLNWGLLAFLWWAVSGFVNPDKTVVVVVDKDDDNRNSRR